MSVLSIPKSWLGTRLAIIFVFSKLIFKCNIFQFLIHSLSSSQVVGDEYNITLFPSILMSLFFYSKRLINNFNDPLVPLCPILLFILLFFEGVKVDRSWGVSCIRSSYYLKSIRHSSNALIKVINSTESDALNKSRKLRSRGYTRQVFQSEFVYISSGQVGARNPTYSLDWRCSNFDSSQFVKARIYRAVYLYLARLANVLFIYILLVKTYKIKYITW